MSCYSLHSKTPRFVYLRGNTTSTYTAASYDGRTALTFPSAAACQLEAGLFGTNPAVSYLPWCTTADPSNCIAVNAAVGGTNTQSSIQRAAASSSSPSYSCCASDLVCQTIRNTLLQAKYTDLPLVASALGQFNALDIAASPTLTASMAIYNALYDQLWNPNNALYISENITPCCQTGMSGFPNAAGNCCALTASGGVQCGCGLNAANQMTYAYVANVATNPSYACNPGYGCAFQPNTLATGSMVDGNVVCDCVATADWNAALGACVPNASIVAQPACLNTAQTYNSQLAAVGDPFCSQCTTFEDCPGNMSCVIDLLGGYSQCVDSSIIDQTGTGCSDPTVAMILYSDYSYGGTATPMHFGDAALQFSGGTTGADLTPSFVVGVMQFQYLSARVVPGVTVQLKNSQGQTLSVPIFANIRNLIQWAAFFVGETTLWTQLAFGYGMASVYNSTALGLTYTIQPTGYTAVSMMPPPRVYVTTTGLNPMIVTSGNTYGITEGITDLQTFLFSYDQLTFPWNANVMLAELETYPRLNRPCLVYVTRAAQNPKILNGNTTPVVTNAGYLTLMTSIANVAAWIGTLPASTQATLGLNPPATITSHNYGGTRFQIIGPVLGGNGYVYPGNVISATTAPITSPRGLFKLILQGNGALQVVATGNGAATWTSPFATTAGAGRLIFDASANLYLYDTARNQVVGTTATTATNAFLAVHDEGYFGIYGVDGTLYWTSTTATFGGWPPATTKLAAVGSGTPPGTVQSATFMCYDGIGQVFINSSSSAVNSVQFQCRLPANGSAVNSPVYGNAAATGTASSYGGYFNTWSGRASTYLNNFLGAGSSTAGSAYSLSCPTGQWMVGANVLYSPTSYVGQITPYCGTLTPSFMTQLGTPGNGTTWTRFLCNQQAGDMIGQVSATEFNHNIVNTLQFQCTLPSANGVPLSSAMIGTNPVGSLRANLAGPFTSWTGRTGTNPAGYGLPATFLSEFQGVGSSTSGTPWTYTCPTGQNMIGAEVQSQGGMISAVMPYCG